MHLEAGAFQSTESYCSMQSIVQLDWVMWQILCKSVPLVSFVLFFLLLLTQIGANGKMICGSHGATRDLFQNIKSVIEVTAPFWGTEQCDQERSSRKGTMKLLVFIIQAVH